MGLGVYLASRPDDDNDKESVVEEQPTLEELSTEMLRLKSLLIQPTGEESEAEAAEILANNIKLLEEIRVLAEEISVLAGQASGENL